MEGYIPADPPVGWVFDYASFGIQYLGDIWQGPGPPSARLNSWSRSVFDNKSIFSEGATGDFSLGYDGPYTWSRYDSSLEDAFVSNAIVTVEWGSDFLDVNARNPILDFVWGWAATDAHSTLIQRVTELEGEGSVPVPSTLFLFILGLVPLLKLPEVFLSICPQRSSAVSRKRDFDPV
jgi:hypothetical protein